MNKAIKISAIASIAAAVLLTAAAALSASGFEDGAFSFLNRFPAELGLYHDGYFSASSALYINIGLILFGLSVCAFMLFRGLADEESASNVTTGFSGILTGALFAATGVFSLNFKELSYIIAGIFFAAVFIMCAIYIVYFVRSADYTGLSIAAGVAAFLAGTASLLCSFFVFSGGIQEVLYNEAKGIARDSFIPFAVIMWAAFALTAVFFVLLAVRSALPSVTDKISDTSGERYTPKKANVKAPDTRRIEL